MRRTDQKRKPVTDPVRDAEERSGGTFERRKTVAPWEEEIARCTTGQFARLDGGYRRHCGPTAITNLILSLSRRYGYLEDPVPAEIFSTVSHIGQKYHIYWNTEFHGHFGGTYNMLTEPYIRACLHHFHIPVRSWIGGTKSEEKNPEETVLVASEELPEQGISQMANDGCGLHRVEIRWQFLPTETQFIRALDAGKLLFLQLQHHPCYGSHHLLCFGYTTVHDTGRGGREIYLLLADGWSRQIRYLRLKGRGLCHFFAIG